jgi:hypothetical protein
MTQVFYFGGTKSTFTLFQEKLVLGEEMENMIHMSKMVCLGFAIDEDIIKENYDKMTEKGTKDMIHEALEGGRGITQAKGHDQKLIVSLMSAKGHLGNVCLCDCTSPTTLNLNIHNVGLSR